MNEQVRNRINGILIVSVVFFLIALVTPIVGYSDPAEVGPNPDVPIDGGITLLLAAAGVAGVKKLSDNKNKNED